MLYQARGPNPETPEEPAPYPPGPEEPAPEPPKPELPDTGHREEPELPKGDPEPNPDSPPPPPPASIHGPRKWFRVEMPSLEVQEWRPQNNKKLHKQIR